LSRKEITPKSNQIKSLAPKSTSKEITSNQGNLGLGIDRDAEIGGIGMGVLSDGTAYLNQRGLAALCGVQNAHIGTISTQWNENDPKPRIALIRSILDESGLKAELPHVEVVHKGTKHLCYPAEICLAVLEYYAIDAGSNIRKEARKNYRILAGSKLREMIYSNVGYDPSGQNQQKFDKWHDRLAINSQSCPRNFFEVFTESSSIIYEMIVAGVTVDEKTIVDGSIGTHWSKFWDDNGLDDTYAPRNRYPHYYPDDHPQSAANPHQAWCYPMSALGEFRMWLYDIYVGDGKMRAYLKGKAKRGDIAPSVAQLVVDAIEKPRIAP